MDRELYEAKLSILLLKAGFKDYKNEPKTLNDFELLQAINNLLIYLDRQPYTLEEIKKILE